MSDKTVGTLIFIASVLLMVGYFWWLFLAPPDWIILGRPLSDWALIVPVAIIVYAFLFIEPGSAKPWPPHHHRYQLPVRP